MVFRDLCRSPCYSKPFTKVRSPRIMAFSVKTNEHFFLSSCKTAYSCIYTFQVFQSPFLSQQRILLPETLFCFKCVKLVYWLIQNWGSFWDPGNGFYKASLHPTDGTLSFLWQSVNFLIVEDFRKLVVDTGGRFIVLNIPELLWVLFAVLCTLHLSIYGKSLEFANNWKMLRHESNAFTMTVHVI